MLNDILCRGERYLSGPVIQRINSRLLNEMVTYDVASIMCQAVPWRIEVPMQSVPVSPPPITMTFLSLALM